VIRLLLGFLEEPQMPRVVREVLAGRCDPKFVRHLCRALGSRISKTAAETLAQFETFAWARAGHEVLAELDDAEQEGAVQLLLASSVDRQQALEVIGHLLLEGKPGGRRAAARALARFQSAEAAALTLKALDDEDPEVRAAMIVQLRPRKIPGAFSLLIRLVDHPQEEVQQALREALPEFTFQHFMGSLDSMADELRRIAGHLVRKIDAGVEARLAAEMECLSPVRRRRAVLAAAAMGLVRQMEQTIIKRLSDEDHMVRVAAAKALADCTSAPTWEALRDALLDRSYVVREAAEESLEKISGFLMHPETQSAPEGPAQPTAEEIRP
jgi:HEAT repeat protein